MAIDWPSLIDLIEYQQLAPIIGKELLVATENGTTITWEQKAVRTLIGRLKIETAGEPTLGDLAQAYLENLRTREDSKRRFQKELASLIQDEDFFPIPEALLRLADVRDLDLVISTTPDHLAKRAFEKQRATVCTTTRFGLLRNDYGDVPGSTSADSPAIFHLFGTVTESDRRKYDFAVTDEDLVEFLFHFQAAYCGDSLPNLFDQVSERKLLLLGCDLPDGIVRTLMRALVSRRFYPHQENQFADSRVLNDKALGNFVREFSTSIYDKGSSVDFVLQLAREYEDEIGDRPTPEETDAAEGDEDSEQPIEEGKVFISYRRKDYDAVSKIVSALRDRGLPVWFDEDLEPGVAWRHQEQMGVKKAALFLPVISKNSAVGQSEAMKEWNLALEVEKEISRDTTYIIPLCIDDTGPGAEHVPPEFWDRNLVECRDGALSPDDADAIREKFRERQREARQL